MGTVGGQTRPAAGRGDEAMTQLDWAIYVGILAVGVAAIALLNWMDT